MAHKFENDRPIPHDLPFTWLVPSRSRGGQHHMVDLSHYNGNGECFCEHFQIILRPKLEKVGHPYQPRMRCRHIIYALHALHSIGSGNK